MFAFDQSALPQLKPRRAFVAVDFQNEFTAEDGALFISEPPGYVHRAAKLASAFRDRGDDVVWVKSRFDGCRGEDEEQIIVTDRSPSPAPAETPVPEPLKASRRKVPASVRRLVEANSLPDPEAFLSDDEPSCLQAASSPACDWSTEIRGIMQKSDMTFTKTHYSAFNDTRLLHVLRAKMVMEVFICGSLANVGVYATAMDAAGHGLSITVVEDCCGYRSQERQKQAVKSLVDFTGCEVVSSQEALESIQSGEGKPTSSSPTAYKKPSDSSGGRAIQAEQTPDLIRPMSALRLKSESPSPTSANRPSEEPRLYDQPQKMPGKVPQTDSTPLVKSYRTPESNKTIIQSDDQLEAGSAAMKEPKQEHDTPSEKSSPENKVSFHKNTDRDEEQQSHQAGLCEGDTDIIEHVLPDDLEEGVFEKLRDEIAWKRMSHQGGEVPRLVAVQGEVADDGSIPVYRHPADESPPLLPFSPTVMAVKAATEKYLGHTLNHVLIQYYRDGKDYISEHSDKTLDICQDSYIANVSLGAERTMVLRTKRHAKDPSFGGDTTTEGPRRETQRARLPHNSLCRMGLKTNMKWLHSIRQDKRADRDKSTAELAFAGGRISLTFRKIGTFLDKDEKTIWGQGATGKTRKEAHAVINGTGPEAIEMLKAFGAENNSSTFDWDSRYGRGFDVLHMSNSPRFFGSPDSLINMRIALMLAELGVNYAKGSMGPAASDDAGGSDPHSLPIKFVDADPSRSVVQGDIAIMMYLDRVYGAGKAGGGPKDLAKVYSRFQQGLQLHEHARAMLRTPGKDEYSLKSFKNELEAWNIYAEEAEGGFLAGANPTLPDFVVWPVLHTVVDRHGMGLFEGMDSIKKYYETYKGMEAAQKVLGQ